MLKFDGSLQSGENMASLIARSETRDRQLQSEFRLQGAAQTFAP